MAHTPRPNAPPDEVEAIVNDVADGFTDLLPPELLEEAKTFILDAFAAQPLGVQLAERVRPREADRSGEQAVDGELVDESPEKAGGGVG